MFIILIINKNKILSTAKPVDHHVFGPHWNVAWLFIGFNEKQNSVNVIFERNETN